MTLEREMIVCWRTVRVPAGQLDAFVGWIDANGALRREHGILFELVLRTSPRQNPTKAMRAGDVDVDDDDVVVVVTGWPDHDTFDRWIDTPDRDRLTASAMHDAVEFRPLVRFDLVGGYVADSLMTNRPDGGR